MREYQHREDPKDKDRDGGEIEGQHHEDKDKEIGDRAGDDMVGEQAGEIEGEGSGDEIEAAEDMEDEEGSEKSDNIEAM